MSSSWTLRHGSAALLLAAVAAPCTAQTATVELYGNLSPVRAPNDMGGYYYVSPNFAAYQSSVLAGLAAGGVAVGSGPGGFQPLTRTDFTPLETTGTPFHSWRGELDPTGAYAAEFGTYLRVATRVVSSTVFNLDNVVVGATGSDFELPALGINEATGAPLIFGADVAGLWWGADGVRGTGDDVFYGDASAGATTLLNELFWTGAAFVNFYYFPEDVAVLGSPQAVLDDANNYYKAYSPYQYGVTVGLHFDGRTVAESTYAATITPVPEPETWALMSAALAFMTYRQRRRGKARD